MALIFVIIKKKVPKAITILNYFVRLFMNERSVINHNLIIMMVSATDQNLGVVSTVYSCP